MTNTIDYEYDAFISYNRADEAWARHLATLLEREHWQGRRLKVFFAPWDIKPGESIPERLEHALPRSRKVCLIMSPESAESEWVRVERYVALHIDITEQETRLIPLYLRASKIPAFLQYINRIDFQDGSRFADNYRVLLATIKDEPLPRGEQDSSSSVVSVPVNIPRPPVVGFVARRDTEGRDILERLKEELAPGKNQLVVLSGPGGVGKTTLAAETARALLAEFANRIVWISASGREVFALPTLFDEIVTQLGRADLRPLAPAQKEEQVRALVAAPATLVVLDNFETIKPAEQTRCVEFLYQRANCPALITTRQRVNPARNIPIAVMTPEEADDFLRRLIEQANDPNAFAGLDHDRIMQASERNPLVLQWVVAQIDLAQEAETVLNELSHGTGDAAQRVFNRSFELEQVGEDGRAALLALSLFVPDASRAALAEVAGFGDDIGRLNEAVKNLAALWLAKAVPGGRLTIQGLTRELTRAHLSRDNRAADFGQRFVAYFVHYALAHSQPTPEDYAAMEAERDNLLGAMDVAFSLKDWNSVHVIAYLLAGPASGMLSVHGYWDEAIHRNKQALNAARNSAVEREIAAFTHNVAAMYQERGEVEEARKLYDESLAISKKLGNQILIASTLHQLGKLAQEQGKLEEARKVYDESLQISKKLGNQNIIANTLHHLAAISQAEGKLEEARKVYDESLAISKKLGNQSLIASTLHELGRLAQAKGKLEEARKLYDESLEISKKLGNQSGIALTLWALGTLAEREDNNTEAARLYHEALSIFERLGSPHAEVMRGILKRLESESE
ncbi:MAG TPA: toll/interleukin-1 receptor domain-containing protein [Pyrinomonadaceae bacterium]|nr:toll/interleukin-1 receptor domain-containing protein [Pyrinomonadaceae bacterium]